MTLEEATTLLFCLHRDKSGGHERPHKPLLLLTIMELIERGLITEPRISVSDELRATFNEYFPVVRQKDDASTPQNPFYFLSREPFWNLVMHSGIAPIYAEGQAKRAPTWAGLKKKVAYAQLDLGLFKLLIQPLERELLREALIDRAANGVGGQWGPAANGVSPRIHNSRNSHDRMTQQKLSALVQIHDFLDPSNASD